MTETSSSGANRNKIKDNKTFLAPIDKSIAEEVTLVEPLEAPVSRLPEWNVKTQATAIALTLSVLPVLTVGTATWYFGNQSLTQIREARQAKPPKIADL